MGRLGNGYAKYFNARNERSGRLFQAPYQAKLIGDEKYLFGLVNYIHENVSELFLHVKDDRERERAIRDYQWSSYAHYLGLRQDPFLDEAEIRHVFGQPKEYQGLFNP